MPTDLAALLSLEPGRTDALDWFVGNCLCDGGIWESPRTSDGIESIARVLERGPDSLRVCGRIYEIDQTLHAFWLELHRDGTGDCFSWFLCFDVAEASPRRAQNTFHSHDRFEDIKWRATLAGEATVEDAVLAIVPGSTRILIRDMPAPENARELRRRPRGERP